MGLELRTVKWDMRLLELAKTIAGWSKDPNKKVGAIIATHKKHRIISVGYNGFPHGIEDEDELLVDKEYKLNNIIHAEENALLFAPRKIKGQTIYVWPFLPCARCAAKLAQKDIGRVVSFRCHSDSNWLHSIMDGKKTFKRRGIEVVEYEFTE